MANSAKTALLCAYTLAKAGRYADAEELILSEPEVSRTAEAMDLLARIRAEQGNFTDARRLWQDIRIARPDYLPAKNALDDLGKKPMRSRRLLIWGGILAAAVALILSGLLIGRGLSPKGPNRTELSWPGIPTAAMLDRLNDLRGQATRVNLSSGFFADPSKVTHRALLTDMVADRLAVPASAVFVGTAEGDAIRVEIETR